MTLSPVFRSAKAVQLLAEQGVWDGLAPDMEAQAEAVRAVYADLEGVIGERFRTEAPHVPTASEVTTPEGLHFLQEYFFLILFRSILLSRRACGTAPGVFRAQFLHQGHDYGRGQYLR